MNHNLPVVSIQRHRINVDGKGIRTLIHTYGCNLSCKWCCNPETRFYDKYNIYTLEELFDIVKVDDLYFLASSGGITFSGGEPFLHPEFIFEFSKKCHEYDWNVVIESALNVKPEIIKESLNYIDYYFVDIKSMDSEIHKKYTGIDNRKILKNIELIHPDKITINIPVIPSINDSKGNIDKTMEFCKSIGIKRIRLISYRDYSKTKYKKMNLNYDLNVVYDELYFKELIQRVKERGFIVG